MYVEKLPSGWKKNREKAFSKSLFALTDGGCARFARVKQNGSKFVQKIHLHRISRNTRTYPVRVFYTHLNIFFACFATHAFIKRGFCTHLNRNGFCPTGVLLQLTRLDLMRNVVTSRNEVPGERVLAVCHSVTSRSFAPSRLSEKRTPGYWAGFCHLIQRMAAPTLFKDIQGE